jgi:hypothetical protein
MITIKICPRCENSEINPDDNFCIICGLNLKETAEALNVLIDKGLTPEQYELAYFKTVIKS